MTEDGIVIVSGVRQFAAGDAKVAGAMNWLWPTAEPLLLYSWRQEGPIPGLVWAWLPETLDEATGERGLALVRVVAFGIDPDGIAIGFIVDARGALSMHRVDELAVSGDPETVRRQGYESRAVAAACWSTQCHEAATVADRNLLRWTCARHSDEALVRTDYLPGYAHKPAWFNGDGRWLSGDEVRPDVSPSIRASD